MRAIAFATRIALPLLLVTAIGLGCAKPQAGDPVSGRRATRVVLDELRRRADTITVTISLHPPPAEADRVKLRGITLAPPTTRFEPSLLWPDGTPMSGHTRITPEQAVRIVERLAEVGFFKRARRFHSERTLSADRPPPPKGTAPGPAYPSTTPGCDVTVTSHDEYWHTSFVDARPWGPPTHDVLALIRAELDEEGARLLSRLAPPVPARGR